MQEQNFEEEVRRKMAELSFVPTDPVWEKVEKEIRNKKERRRIFFWILPLLLIPGLAYYFMNGDDNTVLPGPATQAHSDNKQLPSNPRQDKPTRLPPALTGAGTKSSTQNTDIVHITSKANLTAPSITHKTPVAITNTNNNKDSGLSLPTNSEANGGESSVVQGSSETVKKADTNDLRQQTNDNKPADVSGELKEKMNTATGGGDSTRISKVQADSLFGSFADSTSALEVVQPKKPAKKRWTLSFNSSLGVAGVSTNALPVFNGGKSGIYQSAAFDNMPGTSASVNAPRSNLRSVVLRDDPSKVRRNIGFSAGLGLNKKINSRFGLSTGLQYTQISTLTVVGRKVESVSSGDFYLNTSLQTKDYITRYHIVELPLSLNWQVIQKTPLKLYAGISVGYLVSTNALQYDGVMNIYYRDKSLYKPAQFSALTGFDYTMMKKSKHPLSIGPKLQFQLSNLVKNKTYGHQHLYFAGIGSSFSF